MSFKKQDILRAKTIDNTHNFTDRYKHNINMKYSSQETRLLKS